MQCALVNPESNIFIVGGIAEQFAVGALEFVSGLSGQSLYGTCIPGLNGMSSETGSGLYSAVRPVFPFSEECR